MNPGERRRKILDRLESAIAKTSVNDPLKVEGARTDRPSQFSLDVIFTDGTYNRVTVHTARPLAERDRTR